MAAASRPFTSVAGVPVRMMMTYGLEFSYDRKNRDFNYVIRLRARRGKAATYDGGTGSCSDLNGVQANKNVRAYARSPDCASSTDRERSSLITAHLHVSQHDLKRFHGRLKPLSLLASRNLLEKQKISTRPIVLVRRFQVRVNTFTACRVYYNVY